MAGAESETAECELNVGEFSPVARFSRQTKRTSPVSEFNISILSICSVYLERTYWDYRARILFHQEDLEVHNKLKVAAELTAQQDCVSERKGQKNLFP